jgi:hypothetical protein
MTWSTEENQSAQVSIDHHILFRLNEDGSHDNTFGTPGTTLRKDSSAVPMQYVLVTTTGFSYSEKVDLKIDQSDGALVMLSGLIPGSYSGKYHNFIARYDVNGIHDSNFGDNGAIGSLFAENGPADSLFNDFSIDSSHRLVTVSFDRSFPMEMIIQRYLSSGLLDPSFGMSDSGTSIVPIGYPETFVSSQSKNIQIISDDANGYLIAFSGFLCPDTQECSSDVFTSLLSIFQSPPMLFRFLPFRMSSQTGNLAFFLPEH